MSPVRGIFGPEMRPVYAEGRKSFDLKQMIIRRFCPAGADIGPANVNSEPQKVRCRTSIGTIVARGRAGTVGCRAVVGGAVEAERSSHDVNANIRWLVRRA